MNTEISTDLQQQKKFKYWQTRTIVATMVGYAMFYFVRKNLSMAMPGMQADLGISKADLGIFLTLHGLVYGVSRFANGFLADRINSRYFMVTGLVLSAICNIFFGFNSAVVVLGLLWVMNGWVQGMGFPPCVRLLTHWIPPNQLATKMSIWNTSHSIGAGLVVILSGYIVGTLGWRYVFYIPAAIALLGAVFLWVALRDTPSSVGLPELHSVNKEDGTKEDRNSKEFKAFLKKNVFRNKYIWILCIANFFVYIVRYGVLDWGPTLLSEWKGVSLHNAGWMVAAFEVSGIAGMLLAGWATDRFFGGRGPRVCMICMIFASLFILIFWQMSHPPMWMATATLMGAGFFIYGPQALIGIAAANIATNRAAATAAGFTGLFGYASAIVSGWGLGYLADHYGWDFTFGVLMFTGIIGSVVFMFAWKAKAHGYES